MKKNSKKKTLSLEKIKIAKLENMKAVEGGGMSIPVPSYHIICEHLTDSTITKSVDGVI
ncbi:hypothetical protein [Aquimarina sp. AD10]|uniref:hypothetical protein n=1 Tax=Aquimarina sp. AD10 TaxID=1714849 RepID=UPI0013145DBA|nr:hypothetical protein [Aquimarina sp. AD10]